MRLNKIRVVGFGKLARGSVDLGPRVIAVVGPNEAGKSTLLDALVYLSDTTSTLSLMRRARTVEVTDDTAVVEGFYVLDEADKTLFVDLDLESIPQTLEMSRHAGDTQRYMLVKPTPQRSLATVTEYAHEFSRSFTATALRPPVTDEEGEVDEADDTEYKRLRERFTAVIERLTEADASGRLREVLPEMAEQLDELSSESDLHGTDQAISASLGRLVEWIRQADPRATVRHRLSGLVPVALLFGEGDRNLTSSFALDDTSVANMPPAIRNLAEMADMDLPSIWADFQAGNRAGYETKLRKANNVLAAKFSQAWRQSDLTVHLSLSGAVLQVDIHQGDDIVTPIDERSAGLRMYVALAAFLERRSLAVKPILLIDEAETHLHIDAQADLVASFMRQNAVAKVIYTTHSPACLPSDLGTNVRAVLPSETNLQESTLENSFWRNAAGFTPLMVAMGAGAAAFSTARHVVLAEGSTEMLMLPSLIRAATGQEELPYQVAPGLSESAPEDYAGLDVEGAHVAFLVDGDAGGSALASGLRSAGIAADLIIQLGALTLEHLLDPHIYAESYRQLLVDWNPGATIGPPPQLSESLNPLWPKQLETWARSQGDIHIPGKRDVASYLAEWNKAVPSPDGKAVIQRLHSELLAALRIE